MKSASDGLCRLGRCVAAILCLSSMSVVGSAWALEFSADQIVKANGKVRKTIIYYRDDRWRLEHNDQGPVNITIVRKDKQEVWLLLSRIKHFKTEPYDPSLAPKIERTMEGEIKRDVIGEETFDGHPTTLYEVTVDRGEGPEQYYQWLATDLNFPLKLAKKDASWIIEYRHLKMRPVLDYLFERPLNFQPLETFDGKQVGPAKE
ncbi:MAG: hypothetical protein U0172_12150 [Nitrospiraceae bacterium]